MYLVFLWIDITVFYNYKKHFVLCFSQLFSSVKYYKYPDAGKDWRQEKGMTEDEMVGRHHRRNGHEFE